MGPALQAQTLCHSRHRLFGQRKRILGSPGRVDPGRDPVGQPIGIAGGDGAGIQKAPSGRHSGEFGAPARYLFCQSSHRMPQDDLLALRVQEGFQRLLRALLGQKARQVKSAFCLQMARPSQVLPRLLQPAAAFFYSTTPSFRTARLKGVS